MDKNVICPQPPGSKEITAEINYLGDLLSNNTKIIQIGPVVAEIYEVSKFERNVKYVEKVKSSTGNISATSEWIWLKFRI